MANDYFDVPGSGSFNDREFVHEVMFGESGDEYADYYFHEVFFGDLSKEQREQMYQDMVQYLWDEYGFQFEDAFDWEDFRASYEEIA